MHGRIWLATAMPPTGKSFADRAKALIGLANPGCRDDLERQARTAGLILRWVHEAAFVLTASLRLRSVTVD